MNSFKLIFILLTFLASRLANACFVSSHGDAYDRLIDLEMTKDNHYRVSVPQKVGFSNQVFVYITQLPEINSKNNQAGKTQKLALTQNDGQMEGAFKVADNTRAVKVLAEWLPKDTGLCATYARKALEVAQQ